MSLTRQMAFWVLTFIVAVAALWVLRGILLPFVAGMALASSQSLATAWNAPGHRLAATLVIVACSSSLCCSS